MISLLLGAAFAAEPIPAAFLLPTQAQEVAPAPLSSAVDLERRVQTGITTGWVGSGMAIGGAAAFALGLRTAVVEFEADGELDPVAGAELLGGTALLGTAPVVRGLGSAHAGKALRATGKGPGPVGGWVAAGLGAGAVTAFFVDAPSGVPGMLYLSSMITGSVHFHRVRYAASR